jgi:hypothetical protein
VTKALAGDRDGAREDLGAVRDLLLDHERKLAERGQEPPDWHFRDKRNLEAAIDALAGEERFLRYCEETRRATAAALGLPGG